MRRIYSEKQLNCTPAEKKSARASSQCRSCPERDCLILWQNGHAFPHVIRSALRYDSLRQPDRSPPEIILFRIYGVREHAELCSCSSLKQSGFSQGPGPFENKSERFLSGGPLNSHRSGFYVSTPISFLCLFGEPARLFRRCFSGQIRRTQRRITNFHLDTISGRC